MITEANPGSYKHVSYLRLVGILVIIPKNLDRKSYNTLQSQKKSRKCKTPRKFRFRIHICTLGRESVRNPNNTLNKGDTSDQSTLSLAINRRERHFNPETSAVSDADDGERRTRRRSSENGSPCCEFCFLSSSRGTLGRARERMVRSASMTWLGGLGSEVNLSRETRAAQK